MQKCSFCLIFINCNVILSTKSGRNVKKNMKIKAAIFDLDGTLLDSMSIWSNLCGEFLLQHNIKEEIDLVFEIVVKVFKNDVIDVSTKMAYRCVQKM